MLRLFAIAAALAILSAPAMAYEASSQTPAPTTAAQPMSKKLSAAEAKMKGQPATQASTKDDAKDGEHGDEHDGEHGDEHGGDHK
jgi:hypothetical protein